METWVWLVAYVVGFGLLQVALYRYLRDDHGALEQATPQPQDRGNQTSKTESTPTEPTDGIRCSNCGAVNEHSSSVRYCQECVSPLE